MNVPLQELLTPISVDQLKANFDQIVKAFQTVATTPVVAPAGTLTGTTLAANVVNSSLVSTGVITSYGGIATVSNGHPAEYATVDSSPLTAAINSTKLYTPTANGMFRISATVKIIRTGTSPVVGPLTITYTDPDDSGFTTQSQVMLMQSVTGAVVTTTVNNSTTTGTINGVIIIFAKVGVDINYAVAISGTFGIAQYAIHLKCEAL